MFVKIRGDQMQFRALDTERGTFRGWGMVPGVETVRAESKDMPILLSTSPHPRPGPLWRPPTGLLIHASAEAVAFLMPFSCLLDGIQDPSQSGFNQFASRYDSLVTQ